MKLAVLGSGYVVPAQDDVMQDADERAEQIKSMLSKLQARLHT